MKRSTLVAIVVLLAVSGCAGPPPPPSSAVAEPSPTRTIQDDRATPVDLPQGSAFGYRAAGSWDVEPEFTIVVARADASGYLFAAQTKDELRSVITWSKPWFGERDRGLNRVQGPASSAFRMFDFPLEEGKRWLTSTRFGINVTAHRANVVGPGGSEPGWVVSGQEEDQAYRWDYVPSLGMFAHFRWTVGEDVRYDIGLTKVGSSTEWVWFESLSNHAYAGWPLDPTQPSDDALHVKDGADVVSAVGYGVPGTHGGIVPPGDPANAWTFEGRGCCKEAKDWIAVLLPAKTGDWKLAALGDPDDYVGIEAAAAKWVTSGS